MEDPSEAGPNYEQKRWEEDHMNRALIHYGAKDAKAKQKVSKFIYSCIVMLFNGVVCPFMKCILIE